MEKRLFINTIRRVDDGDRTGGRICGRDRGAADERNAQLRGGRTRRIEHLAATRTDHSGRTGGTSHRDDARDLSARALAREIMDDMGDTRVAQRFRPDGFEQFARGWAGHEKNRAG